MQIGLSLGLARRYQSVGGGRTPWEPIRLSGTTFSTTQILPALSGSYNPDGDATRIFLSAPNNNNLAGGSLVAMIMKASGAVIRLPNTFNNYTGSVQVSVDGGNYTAINGSAGLHTLFTGLADEPHFVCLKIGSAFGISSAHFIKSATDALVLTGTDTYIDLPSAFAFSNTSGAAFNAAAFGVANSPNYFPALSKFSTVGANIGAIAIRGNFQKIFASLNGVNSVSVYVSEDGAAPTRYDQAPGSNAGGHCFTIPVSAGTKTYYVWTSQKGAVFAVAGDSTQVQNVTTSQIHQFGDSITEGISGTSGDVDVFRIAAAFGRTGLTFGVSGWTVQQIDTGLTTQLPQVTVTSNDVAIVAGGRNNIGGAFDAAETTAYQSIITKLLTKGYGKIICRGILPSGNRDNLWIAENGSIQSIVTGVGNPNVIFLDTSACPPYTTVASDNVHPDAAGYATIAAFLQPLYATALGL